MSEMVGNELLWLKILLNQACSESQKVKSSQSHDFDFFKIKKSQSHDFDFKFLPKNFISKIKIERLKIFRIVKPVILKTLIYKSH